MREKVINFVSIATVLLEGIFLFGIAMGIPNLVNLFRESGVYSHLCEKYGNITETGCQEQTVMFNKLSTLAGVAMNASAVLVGILYDRFGTFVARVFTTLLVTFGLIIVFGLKFKLLNRLNSGFTLA